MNEKLLREILQELKNIHEGLGHVHARLREINDNLELLMAMKG